MLAHLSFGSPNFEERLTRRDGAWTVLHRHAAPAAEAPVWRQAGPRACVAASALDGSLARRVLRLADVPAGADPVAGRLMVLFDEHVAVGWIHADSASPTAAYADDDGDQLVSVIDGSATLDTPCGTLRANPAEHVWIPRGMPHRWRVDKLGLRALVVEARGELALPREGRNAYGQLGPGAPFSQRDVNVPRWFPRPHAAGEPVACVRRRDGDAWETETTVDPMATTGWDGAVYPVAIPWEVPAMRGGDGGARLFVHERFVVSTRVAREGAPASEGSGDLVTLALDADGEAALVWEPRGVVMGAAGSSGGITVSVRVDGALRLTANGALLAARGTG